jgi:hypothetical protein
MTVDLRELFETALSGEPPAPELDLLRARQARRRRTLALRGSAAASMVAAAVVALVVAPWWGDPSERVFTPSIATLSGSATATPAPSADGNIVDRCRGLAARDAAAGTIPAPPDLAGATVVATMSDSAGTSALLRGPSTVAACHLVGSGRDLGAPLRVRDLSYGLTHRAVLAADRFGFDYANLCAPDQSDRVGCAGGELWQGEGWVPAEVARITVMTPDGRTTDAVLRDGFWLFRHVEPAHPGRVSDRPMLVRCYAADGSLLLDVDANAQIIEP